VVEYMEELEPRRGCGYRYVGKLYVRAPGIFGICDRGSLPLTTCPVCGSGIKFSRGWIKLQPQRLFGKHGERKNISCPTCGEMMEIGGWGYVCNSCGTEVKAAEHKECTDGEGCPICNPPEKAYMLWVGEKFYTPQSFIEEAQRLGVSKAVATIPRDFEIGKTIVYLAHRKAAKMMVKDPSTLTGYREVEIPGVFASFRPTHFEMLVKKSDFEKNREKYLEMEEKGIKIIVVPDNYEEMVKKAEEEYRSKKKKSRKSRKT